MLLLLLLQGSPLWCPSDRETQRSNRQVFAGNSAPSVDMTHWNLEPDFRTFDLPLFSRFDMAAAWKFSQYINEQQ